MSEDFEGTLEDVEERQEGESEESEGACLFFTAV